MITNKEKRDQLNELGPTLGEDMKMSFHEAKELVKELKEENEELKEEIAYIRKEAQDFYERLDNVNDRDALFHEVEIFHDRAFGND